MTSLPRLGAPLDWLNFFLADVRGGLGPYFAAMPETRSDASTGAYPLRNRAETSAAGAAAE